jgi:hypothetical protein
MFKKVLLAVALMLATTTSVSAQAQGIFGDSNGDGKVSIEDAIIPLQIMDGIQILVQQYLFEIEPLILPEKEYIPGEEAVILKFRIWGEGTLQEFPFLPALGTADAGLFYHIYANGKFVSSCPTGNDYEINFGSDDFPLVEGGIQISESTTIEIRLVDLSPPTKVSPTFVVGGRLGREGWVILDEDGNQVSSREIAIPSILTDYSTVVQILPPGELRFEHLTMNRGEAGSLLVSAGHSEKVFSLNNVRSTSPKEGVVLTSVSFEVVGDPSSIQGFYLTSAGKKLTGTLVRVIDGRVFWEFVAEKKRGWDPIVFAFFPARVEVMTIIIKEGTPNSEFSFENFRMEGKGQISGMETSQKWPDWKSCTFYTAASAE